MGAIPYIFSPPYGKEKAWHPKALRSRRCMNCHANSDIGGARASRQFRNPRARRGFDRCFQASRESGHSIPYDLRFGGWHLTGSHTFPKSWANSTESCPSPSLPKSPTHLALFSTGTNTLFPERCHRKPNPRTPSGLHKPMRRSNLSPERILSPRRIQRPGAKK